MRKYLGFGTIFAVLPLILQVSALFVIGFTVEVRADDHSPFATESPVIKNFSADEIGTTAKILSLCESEDGILYAGADRLLIFNGADWTQARMDNSSGIWSIFIQGARIWVGSVNEAGYFEKDNSGKYVYTSVTKQLGEDFFGTISKIYSLENSIVFVTQRKVVQLFTSEGVAKITDFQNSQVLRTFLYKDAIYVNQRLGDELKLRTLSSRGFELITSPFSHAKQDATILGRIGNCWIGGLGRDIIARNSETGEERYIYIDQGDLFRAGLNNSVFCSGDYVYIGSFAGGCFVLDLNGNMKRISKAQGLASDTCNAILPSKVGGIWVATDEGISFVQSWNGAGWFTMPSSVRNIHASDQEAYISHMQSAVFVSKNARVDIPELLRTTWARLGNEIYAVSGDKLYKAQYGSANFSTVPYSGNISLRTIAEDPLNEKSLIGSYITPGGPRGFLRLDVATGMPVTCEVSEGSAGYLPDNQGRLWFRSEAGALMMIDEGLSRITQQMAVRKRASLALHEGSPLVLFFDSGFITATGEKIRNTENVTNALGTEKFDGPAWVTGRMDNMLRVGVVARDGEGLVWKQKNIPGLRHFKNVTALYRYKDELWIGGDAGVIRVDTTKLAGPEHTIPPVEIVARDPKAKTQRVLLANTRLLELKNSEQEISLRLKTRVWGLLEPPQYESRLLPIEDEWKRHKYGEDIVRNYVPTGQYTLQVRAYHLSEAGPVKAFAILRPPPWYLSYAAISVFGLVVCGLFYGAVKLRTRQISARNRELEKKIDQRTHELARANAAKSEFLAAMSHEIRNPMNGVIGIVKILQEAKLGAREKYYLTTLHRCAEQLRTTVDDVLDFSKIEAGQVTLHPDTFDLSDTIHTTISALDLTGDRLELASWAGLRPMVTGDQGKFCQILTNYFSNALKYGVPPSASIDVYVLNEGTQRCRVTVAVKNTGPDIPPHEQATLFETFTRGEFAKRGRIGGSGLGLSICKKYAEAMGGSVAVTSSGGLTVFQVTIPFEIANTRRDEGAATAGPRSLNARALAIEDEDYNRLVLGNILAKLGYKVDWACDGKSALQLAQQNGYDLILTDLMLPDTDGGTLTQEILKFCDEPKPPIFAVTAYSTKEKEDECIAAGMAGFISKPITVEKLEAAIQGWASRHRSSAKPFVEQAPVTANITVAQLAKLGPLEVILPDFMRKIQSEWQAIDRMLEDRECTPAANAAHKLISAMLIVEADVVSDQLRLLESRLRDGALESEIEKVRAVCREEVANVVQALQAALTRHHRFNADRSQK